MTPLSQIAGAATSLFLGLALLLATACNSGAAGAIERKEHEMSATATARAAEGAATGRVKTSGDVAITLHDVQYSEKAVYVAPKEGHVFLLLDVTFANHGTGEVTIGSRHFRLTDATGTVYPKTLSGGTKPAPESTLPPGRSSRGELAYEVPKDVRGFTWSIKAGDGADEVAFELTR